MSSDIAITSKNFKITYKVCTNNVILYYKSIQQIAKGVASSSLKYSHTSDFFLEDINIAPNIIRSTTKVI